MRLRILLIGPMRILTAEPEDERLSRGTLAQERFEIGEYRAGGIARAPSGFHAPGSPPLPRVPHVVSGTLEQIGIDRESLRQKTPEHAPFGEFMRIASRQQRRTRRRARRRRCECVCEQRAFSGHAIERWRFYCRVTVDPRMRPRPIVGNRQQDIRPRGRRLRTDTQRDARARDKCGDSSNPQSQTPNP